MRRPARPRRLLFLMRVLFDHNVPSGAAKALAEHEVVEALQRGWDRLSNGELLSRAEEDGFDVLVTADKRIRYQQNLKGRKIAIVVLGNPTWRILRRHLDRVTEALNAAAPGSYAEVPIPFE
jgi:hypothetical protein